MARKKDDDVAAVYASVMDHVVGEVHDDLVAHGAVSYDACAVLAVVRAHWEAKLMLARHAAADEIAVGEYGHRRDNAATSSSLRHVAPVKEEEATAARLLRIIISVRTS
uniref:Uncharacterized protein n=1 Tax=Leersia perrieri TaxID=77586 RepID=A0A0D9VCU4_9ORYZ